MLARSSLTANQVLEILINSSSQIPPHPLGDSTLRIRLLIDLDKRSAVHCYDLQYPSWCEGKVMKQVGLFYLPHRLSRRYLQVWLPWSHDFPARKITWLARSPGSHDLLARTTPHSHDCLIRTTLLAWTRAENAYSSSAQLTCSHYYKNHSCLGLGTVQSSMFLTESQFQYSLVMPSSSSLFW